MAQAQTQQAPQRSLTRVAGDLYRFQNNFHVAAVYVTPAGIVVTDPINAAAAQWLKEELTKQFPNQSVRYLVYSHDHADHSSGGEVYDGAVVVAHRNAHDAIVGEKRPTAVPQVTFGDSLSLQLGNKTINLHYVGRNHSNNSIVVHFPAERAIFAVDFIPVKSLPFRGLPDSYFPDWIESLQRVEAMDFDILVPGHGANGNKSDVVAMRQYLSELHAAVLQGVRAGKSVNQLKQTITMEKYTDWAAYRDFLPLNI
jgi:glyoxylase-like metal-dependent hydrolase (beta-lactamase superfamily II)